MKRYGSPKIIVTDRLASYGAALESTADQAAPAMRALAEQSGGKLTPAVPKTGRGHGHGSGISRPYRSSPQATLPSIITSTTNATSLVAISTNKTALLPWLSGGCWLLERLLGCVDQRPFVIGLTPPSMIMNVAWLCARFTLSFRNVEEMLAERGVDVSNEAVRRWFLEVWPAYSLQSSSKPPATKSTLASRRNGH